MTAIYKPDGEKSPESGAFTDDDNQTLPIQHILECIRTGNNYILHVDVSDPLELADRITTLSAVLGQTVSMTIGTDTVFISQRAGRSAIG